MADALQVERMDRGTHLPHPASDLGVIDVAPPFSDFVAKVAAVAVFQCEVDAAAVLVCVEEPSDVLMRTGPHHGHLALDILP